MTQPYKPLILALEDSEPMLHKSFRVVELAALQTNTALLPEIEGVVLGKHVLEPAWVTTELFDQMTSLKVVTPTGIGCDSFLHLLPYFKKRGIVVTKNTGERVMCKAVADVSMGLALMVARHLHRGVNFLKTGACQSVSDPEWRYWHGHTLARTVHLTGATMGVVGLGRIGYEVAKRAHHGFDMTVLYHSRTRRPADVEAAVGGAEYCASLAAMLPRCDVVAVCCDLNDETRGLFGRDQFRLMKPTAIITNVARGGIIDTDALVWALESGEIGGAGLDVTLPEPLPSDHPLHAMDNVVITPHMAFGVRQVREELAESHYENLKTVLIDKLPPRNMLNL